MVRAHVKQFLDSASVTRSIQVVAVLSLILAIVVGFRQYSLASCLQDYQDASSVSTTARAEAAAEDRKADEADRQADADDRVALKALVDALAAGDQVAMRAAIPSLAATYKRTDEARMKTAQTRKDNEKKRRENPVPPPPSLQCS